MTSKRLLLNLWKKMITARARIVKVEGERKKLNVSCKRKDKPRLTS